MTTDADTPIQGSIASSRSALRRDAESRLAVGLQDVHEPLHATASGSSRDEITLLRILIVDDHPTNRKLLSASLKAEGHHVLEAADGLAALAALSHLAVDAIVSDVLMPNVDGFQLCLAVRTNPRLCTIPFIIYSSTCDSAGDRELAAKVGADEYITKPSPVASLLGCSSGSRVSRATPTRCPAPPWTCLRC